MSMSKQKAVEYRLQQEQAYDKQFDEGGDYPAKLQLTIERLDKNTYKMTYENSEQDWAYTCATQELLDELQEHIELMEIKKGD